MVNKYVKICTHNAQIIQVSICGVYWVWEGIMYYYAGGKNLIDNSDFLSKR